ncbi:MAG TPA: GntR family transcriptional regulator [Acidimicrobiales bacterium]|jgi:DNA-binding transcriptional regulator YhcF (GntR family)|nr:GntR family transcriptional regulator [Acidimicrobiales bacterium]
MDWLRLESHSPVPPFEQVRAQLAAAIESGRLEQSVRLPTVRQLAADLGLAVNTVAKSYRQLERAGLIETRGRHGTFVAGAPTAKRALAMQAAKEFTTRMRELGIGNAETLAILNREVERAQP